MTRRKRQRAPQPLIGRVVRAQSGLYAVQTDAGVVTATLRGRLKKERQDMGLVALGDFVRYEPAVDGASEGDLGATIVEILPRVSVLARRAPGPRGVWARDVIVANIDVLVTVFAAREPEPRLGMLDRFLALAEMDELECLIVLNKVDLGIPAELERRLAVYEAIGYRLLRASAARGDGIGDLREALGHRVSAVVGPSGVGKSSLLNAIQPGLGLKVGTVSEAVHKGRHTTRVGQLHALSGGGLVADTPGLREIGMWDVDPGELEWAYVEFRPFLRRCRFYDCTHTHEPECAIREAADRGEIAVERYESYRRLLADEDVRGSIGS